MPSLQAIDSTPPGPSIDMQVIGMQVKCFVARTGMCLSWERDTESEVPEEVTLLESCPDEVMHK
jgi:hypothetical protein